MSTFKSAVLIDRKELSFDDIVKIVNSNVVTATQSGYQITFIHNEKQYEIQLNMGIRGTATGRLRVNTNKNFYIE